MESELKSRPRGEALEGENLKTTRWEDARHWIGIYADLLDFKVGLIERVKLDMAKLPPVGQKAVAGDVRMIEGQMEGYRSRLELWYRRLWDLHGLWLDPEARVVRHQGKEAEITQREFQLLQYLVDHPHQFRTTSQIVSGAWSDRALSPEEVRNYVRRLRKVLRELDVPADVVNRPSRGYSLVLRS